MDSTESLMQEETISLISSKKIIYFGFKRIMDILIGIVGIIILIPLVLIVKIINICCGDFNSIFYKQKRIGKNGKPIYIYKFRTMVPNADEILKNLLKQEKYMKEWKANQKLNYDPRITKAGKILRKTSLDEFPQFINVLIGDMSLIGPRPLVEGELDLHNGNHKIYESIRPGITGWWAANGRSATDYEKRLELEYFYVKNCSVWLDIKCLFRTTIHVIKQEGAK